jgi:hypothetical protein
MSGIKVTDLARAAEQWDPILRVLPFDELGPKLSQLGINLIEVSETKTRSVIFQRRGGVSRPYKAGATFDAGEIGKASNRDLIVYPSILPLIDNIQNYREKKIVNNQVMDNQSKKHPIELLMLQSIVRTASEDILDALVPAVFDDTDASPTGMFDGLSELIATDISAGNISAGIGNYKATGAMTTPTDESSANTNLDLVVDFLKYANRFLQKRGILYMTLNSYFACIKSLKIVNANFQNPTMDDLVNYFKNQAGVMNLTIKMDAILGTGYNLMYTTAGNIELGMRAAADVQFVSVRTPFEDPNLVQFWSQWEAGMRILNVDPKEFLVNDQSWVGNSLSGDYQS